MSDAYQQLLAATIRELENQKARGIRHVPVQAETLAALNQRSPAASTGRTTAAASASPAPAQRPPAPPTSAAPLRKPVFTRSTVSAPTKVVSAPPPPPPTLPPMDPVAKAAAFAALREKVVACVKCPNLVSSRKQVVFGVGNPDAELMFVGEAPGADEDIQGEPFVGAAGQLLTKIITATGLSRQQVYIANILKCRPDTPGQTSGNRKPTTEEMATCIPWLHEQIDLVRPKVLVALGATAVEGLLGKTIGITRLRGNWQTYRGIPLMPTYHPAYLLRNQAMSEKRRVWEDMLAVMEQLKLPISEKQRGFFLSRS
jgi:DNA polymerase